MTKTKKPTKSLKWQCPVCGDIRYDKVTIPMTGYDQSGNATIYQGGQHYECRGCSVKFGSPRRFNKVKV